ncbi:glycosyltransferase family 2 protein [Aeromonas hydrophila]|uniref:glycosyltransferase family 2 protein n=1 Tax=Aeromonas hydrophila TaxID=644 RepID=UPI001454FDEC|nr:glycosyltransferase [Aeromonas hydrophila]NLR34704.1 glycosyltransferase [Aeromonas hydrophila]
MRVSIVIPCYQQEEYLNRALESIDKQDYQDIEVIVVDDGSAQPVQIIQEKYSFLIKLIRQSNQGLSSARNAGLVHSSGTIIKFLDADDTLLPGCISAQVVNFYNGTEVISVIGFVEHDEDTNATAKIIPAFGDPLSALMMDNLAPIHSYMFLKSALEKIGGFSTDSRVVNGCEDYDLVFRLAIAGSHFYSSHQCGVVYFRRIGTMSKNKYGMQLSRVEVWLHNVSFLLKCKPEVSVEYIIPMLSGLAKIHKWLQTEHQSIAQDIITIINGELAKHWEDFPRDELSFIKKNFASIALFSPVVEYLNSVLDNDSSVKININTIEVNNYKHFLNAMKNKIEDEWVIKILLHAKKYSGRIGIYGAGEYGVRIHEICKAAGYEIKCYFDKSLFNSVSDCGIPIYHPNDIVTENIALVIIASVAFYDEIYESLKGLPCIVI